MAPDSLPEPVRIACDVARLFERLGVPYLVAGSLASSLHGEPRSTNDIDLVADVRSEHVAGLVAALAGGYYVDDAAVQEAVRQGGSFNAVHLATAVKVDVFVAGTDPFDAERIARRVRARIGEAPGEEGEVYVDLPEHTVLRKLEWYRRGGESSERQWRDVIGVLRAQGSSLDRERMERWAGRLGVADLLAEAEGEASRG